MTTYLLRANEKGDILDASGQVVGRVVPVEAQWKMLCAGTDYDTNDEHADLGADVAGIYRAMLSAATIDLSAVAVRVPERKLLGEAKYGERYARSFGWNTCLDALGVK